MLLFTAYKITILSGYKIKNGKEMFQKVPEEIIQKALFMYAMKNTRYLQEAQIDRTDDAINLIAKFSINDCCYAPDSGHFNAVEAIICINQMIYVALLGGIDKKILPFYAGFTPDDFLPHYQKVYISVFEKIKFKKLIDGSSFFGKITMKLIRKVGDNVYGECRFGFGNDEECTDFIGDVKGTAPLL